MRIISKQHDYYDGVAGYGGHDDGGKIWLRKRRKQRAEELGIHWPSIAGKYRRHQIQSTPFENGRRWSWAHIQYVDDFKDWMIGFCGTIYYAVELRFTKTVRTSKGPRETTESHFFFDLEELTAFVDTARSDKTIGRDHHLYNLKTYFEPEHFPLLAREPEKNLQLFIDNSLMAFAFERDQPDRRRNDHQVIIDPVLKDFRFGKIFDAYSAWQEAAMFLEGVLATPEKPNIELTEKQMVQSKGFDPQYGFRKPPNN